MSNETAGAIEWIGPVIATSFADLDDLRRFSEAKASGMTDGEAFRVGDNGIGFNGDMTAQEHYPMCALPPEAWRAKWGDKHGALRARVEVFYAGKSVIGILGDTMPDEKQRTNGAGIDLNPAFLKFFGLAAPLKLGGFFWRWL